METERVRAQLERILASPAFADAERARSFLRFVVNRALERRTGEIKESVIAVEALGRNSSFDSKSDPIVRVEARRLRERLDSYYEREGRPDRVVISVPKGGYVPDFAERQPQPEAMTRTTRPALLLAGWVLFGLAALALVWSYLRKTPDSAGTVRLSIIPPEHAYFESFAVSPDGRKIAFTGALNGGLKLWVRTLDSVEAKLLAGIDNPSYPFWSPDSRSIGFYARFGKLQTLDIAGGPPRDIADIQVGRGADWSTEGIIAFSPGPGILYQVAAKGGTPKPITSLDPARAEVSHGMPQFLPDGHHFLYLAESSRPGESSIRVGSLDSTTSKVLVKADTGSAFAPVLPGHPGSLLFVHSGSLMAQPFDLRRLELVGEPTVIVPLVRFRRWFQGGFSVSRNGVLLYQSGRPENQQFTWFDRNGRLLSEVGPRNSYSAFSLSPDESHLAVMRSDDPDAMMRIWVVDLLHDGVVSRLDDTRHPDLEFAPVWSPKSSELLFSRGDGRRLRLLRQPLNDGPAKPLLDTDGPKWPTDWSSDGRFITFSTQWPDYRNMHTWTVPLSDSGETGEPHPFLRHTHDELSAYFSPSPTGRAPLWIAYTSNETGRFEIYVRDFPAGNRKRQVSTRGGWLPHWRRDGRELFYVAPDGMLMAAACRPGVTFQSDTPQALFETGLRMTNIQLLMNQYAVARDGTRFLINRLVPEPADAAITAVIPW
jgi:WD40 repeat protein